MFTFFFKKKKKKNKEKKKKMTLFKLLKKIRQKVITIKKMKSLLF